MIAAAVSSDVCSARITSTSFSTGTGLKKCIPITRSGRDVTAASDVIGIDDVFEARIAPSGRIPSARRKSVLLHRRVLDDGLDHQVGGDELVDRGDPREHLVRVGAALLGEPLEALAHRRQAALRRTGQRVVERDATAGAATTCAMPPPIWPAPTTRTCSKSILESLSGTLGRGSGVHPT